MLTEKGIRYYAERERRWNYAACGFAVGLIGGILLMMLLC